MNEVERLLAERACERLLYDYCRCVDFGNASKMADLFVEDGVWEADDLVLAGRDAIHAHFLKREKVVRRVSRHLCTNVQIDVLDEDHAEGLSYFTNLRHDRAEGDLSLPVPIEVPKYTGEYRMTFVRTAEGWRFKLQHVDVAFLRTRAG